MSLFQNGNARVARLVIYELASGVLIMVIGQILGMLPSQDWINPRTLKIIAFVLGTAQVTVKGCELFFSKTAAMFKGQDPNVKLEPETKAESKP